MCSRKEYFETLKLEQGGVVTIGDNKDCKVHGIGKVKHKMFDDREFLLHKLIWWSRLLHKSWMCDVEDFLCEVIIDKEYKICGLYILEGLNVIIHSLSTSEDF